MAWERSLGGDNHDYGISVLQEADGGFLVIGDTRPFGEGSSALLIRTNARGEKIWEKAFGKNFWSTNVHPSSDGGYVIVGAEEGYIRVIKTDPDGNQIWAMDLSGQHPYYVKPTQDQIHDFYTLIDDSLKCPLLLYNNPGRCAISMSVETIVKLSSRKTIVGIKEADADITRPTKFLNSINRTDFAILSGNSSTPAFLAEGGHGTISVTSNVDPVRCVQNVNAWFDQDLKTFARLRQELIDLDEALYLEPAPATIKYALSVRGICSDEVRLPLGRFTDKHKPEINQLLSSMNLGKV